MLFLGDHFEGARGSYSRFRGRLKDCRNCKLQTRCMQKPVKAQGRQVSFLNAAQEKTSYLDLMKQKIDSEEGRRIYSRRMWTIEPDRKALEEHRNTAMGLVEHQKPGFSALSRTRIDDIKSESSIYSE